MQAYCHNAGSLLPLARLWEPSELRPNSPVLVRRYAKLMLERVLFPPITVRFIGRWFYRICDGAHRWAASLLAGFGWIPATIVEPTPWGRQ
jgi:ParB-like chromosome segregation protein Spo0J